MESAFTEKVAVSVAETTASIVVESESVKVSPATIVWEVVQSESVNSVLEVVKQVAQVRVSEPPRATEPPPPKGPEVFIVREEFTNSALPIELFGKTTSPSPVE